MEWNYIHFHRIETRGRDVKKKWAEKKKSREKFSKSQNECLRIGNYSM